MWLKVWEHCLKLCIKLKLCCVLSGSYGRSSHFQDVAESAVSAMLVFGADSRYWPSHRVNYRLCLLKYQRLNGLVPCCLSRFCLSLTSVTVTGCSQLFSAEANKLPIPESYALFCQWSFVTSGPEAGMTCQHLLRAVTDHSSTSDICWKPFKNSFSESSSVILLWEFFSLLTQYCEMYIIIQLLLFITVDSKVIMLSIASCFGAVERLFSRFLVFKLQRLQMWKLKFLYRDSFANSSCLTPVVKDFLWVNE